MTGSNPARTAELFAFPQSEDVLRSIMENAPTGMALVDAEGTVVHANQSYADMFGYSLSECIGLRVADLVDESMANEAEGQLGKLIRGEIGGYRADRRYRRRDGQLFWGLVSASAVRNHRNGRLLYLILQVVDIDRQKKTEAALAEAENRWNFALESTGQGVWDVDLKNGRSFYSRTWRTIRGFAPDEEIDGSQAAWLARVHPDDRAEILERTHRLNAGESPSSEFEYREQHRDGHWVWILSRGRPVERMPDGSIARIIGTDTDISRLKAAEAQLAVALANMADALVMYDRDERLVMCNEQYRAMFPKTAHLRVPGTRFRDILRASLETGEEVGVAPGREEAWIERTCASLRVAGDSYIHLGDGRWLHSRVRPTADGGSLSVISDVTKSRLAEQKLAELNLRLEELARLDGLTGLTNRRAFDEALRKELRRSIRTGSPLSLFIVDVDRFKAFNDTYGHPAGDDCLRTIAGIVRKTLRRPADVAARYGGEEFVAILPDTPIEGALELAEILRSTVAGLSLPHTGSEKGIVTVSVGVASSAGGGSASGVADLVGAADEALYQAKAAGRDRVQRARPGRPGDGTT